MRALLFFWASAHPRLFRLCRDVFAAYPTESPGDIMSMLNVVRLPLLFISGVFIPLSSIPPFAQFVTIFSSHLWT